MAPSALKIRPAIKADAEALLELLREFAAHHNEESTATADKLRDNLLEREPEYAVWLAEWDGQPAGFAITHIAFESTVAERGTYLSDLHVSSAFRRKGIARKIIAHLARHAKAQSRTFLWWYAMQDNPQAAAFYKTLGTETTAIDAHWLFEDAFEDMARDD